MSQINAAGVFFVERMVINHATTILHEWGFMESAVCFITR
nr:MAG TPA: hypothetical protein [Caudoviricetes sp.]